MTNLGQGQSGASKRSDKMKHTGLISLSVGGSKSAISVTKENHVHAIVAIRTLTTTPPKASISGFKSMDNVERCALDSGACDAVLTPRAFSNTCMTRTRSMGMQYLACGGESITNIGEQHVFAIDSEGNRFDMQFQCNDKITRNLAAASNICETGKGVWLGPAPDYRAYIVHNPSQIQLGIGPKTPVNL